VICKESNNSNVLRLLHRFALIRVYNMAGEVEGEVELLQSGQLRERFLVTNIQECPTRQGIREWHQPWKGDLAGARQGIREHQAWPSEVAGAASLGTGSPSSEGSPLQLMRRSSEVAGGAGFGTGSPSSERSPLQLLRRSSSSLRPLLWTPGSLARTGR
jgi:hypothetical protein